MTDESTLTDRTGRVIHDVLEEWEEAGAEQVAERLAKLADDIPVALASADSPDGLGAVVGAGVAASCRARADELSRGIRDERGLIDLEIDLWDLADEWAPVDGASWQLECAGEDDLLQMLETLAHFWHETPADEMPEDILELAGDLRARCAELSPIFAWEWAKSLDRSPAQGTVES